MTERTLGDAIFECHVRADWLEPRDTTRPEVGIAREVSEYLLDHPGATTPEIAAAIGRLQSNVHRCCNRLVAKKAARKGWRTTKNGRLIAWWLL